MIFHGNFGLMFGFLAGIAWSSCVFLLLPSNPGGDPPRKSGGPPQKKTES